MDLGLGMAHLQSVMQRKTDASNATAILSAGLVGREVTAVMLDLAVSLQFWAKDLPDEWVKLEQPFALVDANGFASQVEPGRLADMSRPVVELHRGVVA